MCIMLILLAVL